MNEQVMRWIPFVSEYDEEEKQEMLTGTIPEDEQEILVTDGKSVWLDTFMYEGEFYLDSGSELVSTAVAWMPLPENPLTT